MTQQMHGEPGRSILVTIPAACLFVALSVYVRLSSPAVDNIGADFFGPYATPFLNQLATDITALGGLVVAMTIAVTVGVVLRLVGQTTLAVLVPGGVIGVALLVPLLKLVFNRERPAMLDSPVFHASGASYPSGHTTTGTVLMLLLAYVIHRLAGGRRGITVAAGVVAAAMIGLIGTSRVFLGVHHPTDVAGGILFGVLWAGLCVRWAGRRLDGG